VNTGQKEVFSRKITGNFLAEKVFFMPERVKIPSKINLRTNVAIKIVRKIWA
jgi:hypothetical protein